MRHDPRAGQTRRPKVLLVAMVLAFLLAGCGGAPAPTATTSGGAFTPLPSAALPTATVKPALAATATSPTAAVATGPATAATLVVTVPPLLPTVTATATVGSAAISVRTPAPGAAWQVRDLKVGPGRTYAFLVRAGTEQGTATEYALLKSDDDGKTWAPFAGGLPQADCYNNVNLDYASADSLYVGLCLGGLYHWTGSEWDLVSQQRVGALEVVYGKAEVMWSAYPQPEPAGAGVSRSEDGGRTWASAGDGIGSGGVTYLGIDPRDSNTLYAAAPSLYRGTSAGQWQSISAAEPPLDSVNGIAIEGGNGAVYVSLEGAHQIWRSLSAHAPDVTAITWDLVHDFGAGQAVRVLATGPSAGGVALYANLATTAQAGGATAGAYLPYRSPDGGTTWERIVIPGWID